MGNLRMNADQISYKGGEKPMSVEEAIKNAGNTGLAHTADIAPDFSAESAYNAGDLVYHNGTLYVFTANHAAGAWSTADTQVVTVGGEIATLTGEAADLYSGKANQITIAPFFSENTAYDPGDLVYYNGQSYRCVNAHEGAWDADDFAATTIAGEIAEVKSGLIVESDLISESVAGGVIKKMGNVVMLAIENGTTSTASSGDVLFTIPSKYKPAITVNFVNSIGDKERLCIDINGNVVAKDAITNDYLRFTVTYII